VKVDKEICTEFGLSWSEVVEVVSRVVDKLRHDIVKDVRQKTRRLLIASAKTVHHTDEDAVESEPKKRGRKGKKSKDMDEDEEPEDDVSCCRVCFGAKCAFQGNDDDDAVKDGDNEEEEEEEEEDEELEEEEEQMEEGNNRFAIVWSFLRCFCEKMTIWMKRRTWLVLI
jgi:hypothetical protein